MNIFYLDSVPALAAQYHCDNHVTKMILETAQLLSTAHRVLDGKKVVEQVRSEKTGKLRRRASYVLPDPLLDGLLYRATHINHPSAVWVRTSVANYEWAHCLLMELLKEWAFRYDHAGPEFHKTYQVAAMLVLPPKALEAIPGQSSRVTPIPLRMPDEHKDPLGDAVWSYRLYYYTKIFGRNAIQRNTWRKRPVPDWLYDMVRYRTSAWNEVTWGTVSFLDFIGMTKEQYFQYVRGAINPLV